MALIFHTPYKEIRKTDSRKTRDFKRRRATFLLDLIGDKISVGLAICNPTDNFSRSTGVDLASTNTFQDIKIPEEIKKLSQREISSFLIQVGNSLVESFDRNQFRYINKKIKMNKNDISKPEKIFKKSKPGGYEYDIF